MIFKPFCLVTMENMIFRKIDFFLDQDETSSLNFKISFIIKYATLCKNYKNIRDDLKIVQFFLSKKPIFRRGLQNCPTSHFKFKFSLKHMLKKKFFQNLGKWRKISLNYSFKKPACFIIKLKSYINFKSNFEKSWAFLEVTVLGSISIIGR